MGGKSIESVLNRHSRRLLSLPGVVGIAHGEYDHKPCIKVYIAGKTPQLLRQIPSSLEGYPIRVEESGRFRAIGKL